VTATIEGLLGIETDSIGNRLRFAPRIPADWSDVAVEHVKMPRGTVSLALDRTHHAIDVAIANGSDAISLEFCPDLPLGAKLVRAVMNGKVVAGKVEAHPQQTEASIDVDVPHGTSSLQITFEGGFTLIPENSPPLLGEPSIAPHVVGIHLDQGHFTIDVDVPTGRTSHLQIESDWRMANAIGASMSKVAPNRTDFEFAADPANIASYRRAHLVIDVAR
jgi:hypothetical protein